MKQRIGSLTTIMFIATITAADLQNNTPVVINTNTGEDCNIGQYSIVKNCKLGNNVTIDAHCVIENCDIGDNAVINSHCVLKDSTFEPQVKIGPFAHVSERSIVHKCAAIGTFVQVKRSKIQEGAKAMHFAYLGDATIGKRVNIGAGTITCNYNGVSKFKTIIEDDAFIGSNTTIIAPRIIGKGAYVAAGSVVTKDVPEESLAIERTSGQINKEGYAPKLRERYRQAQQKNHSY